MQQPTNQSIKGSTNQSINHQPSINLQQPTNHQPSTIKCSNRSTINHQSTIQPSNAATDQPSTITDIIHQMQQPINHQPSINRPTINQVLVAWSNEGVWASSIGGKTKAGRCMAIECWLVGGLDVWSHGTVDRMYKKGECEKGEERRDNVG
jgi:hypothetical protein